MTKTKNFKLSENYYLSIYHFYDNWIIRKRYTNIDISLISFGWETFSKKEHNIYFMILGIYFSIMRVRK